MLNLFSEFNRVVEALQASKIRYALAGGLAVAVHGGVRTTKDIDFLVHAEDADAFGELLKKLGYSIKATRWTFSNSKLTLRRFFRGEKNNPDLYIVDVLEAAERAHLQMIHRAMTQKWAQGTLRVLRPPDLIKMKKARNSPIDQGDIEVLEQKRGSKRKQS